MSAPAACCYHLYVGDSTCYEVLVALKSLDVSAATVSPASGLWQGDDEPCTIVTLIENQPDNATIEDLARRLAVWFKQDCVFVTRSDIAFTALVKQD